MCKHLLQKLYFICIRYDNFRYVAPEYAETGQITEKADVYAFGVVLLEILTGRKAVIQQGAKGGVLLTDWVRDILRSTVLDNYLLLEF